MYALVYNPLRCSKERCDEIESTLKSKGIGLRIFATGDKDDPEAVRKTCEGCERIIIAGGDGTVHKVVNATYDMDPIYAILPIGTGNDFARSIGAYGSGIDVCTDDSVIDVDSWSINGKIIFLTSLTYGLPLLINNNSKDTGKDYSKRNLFTILSFKRIPIKMKCDGESFDDGYYLMNIQNIKYIGGGMTISREADCFDGTLNIVACGDMNAVRKALCLLSAKRKGLSTRPKVLVLEGKEIDIETVGSGDCMIDGEMYSIPKASVRYNGKLKFVGKRNRIRI